MISDNTDAREIDTSEIDTSETDHGAQRRLVILSGPTAVGKGTVEKAVRAAHPQLWISVSATTRQPRPGETDGVDYHFVSTEEFERMEREGQLLEFALVHGTDYYGTPLKPVLEHLKKNLPSLLEIDVQGVHRVKARAKELGLNPVYVFLAPPSFDDLKKRLQQRHTETPDQQERRLETARKELAQEGEFDIVIVNDQVDKAARALWDVIEGEYQA